MEKLIKNYIVPVFVSVFSGAGVAFSAIEVIGHFWEQSVVFDRYIDTPCFVIVCSILAGVIQLRACLKKEIVHCVNHGKIVVCKSRDILRKKSGTIVVGVNRQLETQEEKIDRSSIHGQMIKKYGQDKMQEIFDNGKLQMRDGTRLFFNGKIKNKHYIFLQMSDLEDECLAVADKQQVAEAVDNLLRNQQRAIIEKQRLYVPVLGTGAAGVSLDRMEMIRLLAQRYSEFLSQLDREKRTGVSDGRRDAVNRINEFCIVTNDRDIDWQRLETCIKSIGKDCRFCNCKDKEV